MGDDNSVEVLGDLSGRSDVKENWNEIIDDEKVEGDEGYFDVWYIDEWFEIVEVR